MDYLSMVRNYRRAGLGILTLLFSIACSPSQPNVDATIQAGVRATVSAQKTSTPTQTLKPAEPAPIAVIPLRPVPTFTPTNTPVATFTPTNTPVPRFSNVFAYCSAVGTVDKPDSRWNGPEVPNEINAALSQRLRYTPPGVQWRCYNGVVLACDMGNNINCWTADTNREPNKDMVDYCGRHLNDSGIPLYLTGHATIYSWGCKQGTPAISRQFLNVDPRGFVKENWYAISPR